MPEALIHQTPDAIVKTVTLKAPLPRVWNAITDPAEFRHWFGMAFDRPFIAHTRMTGTAIPNTVNAGVAANQEPFRGTPVEFVIYDITPMRLFSFRWHPFAVEPGRDYSTEPMTLVTFELEPIADGVHLTITEQGFHRIPLERRAQAFGAEGVNWMWQCQLIEGYLAR
jgi:uncharacterized protein YndB with AHSA1/START domain